MDRREFLAATAGVISGGLIPRCSNGVDITTIQWESTGGMRSNFKVMAILPNFMTVSRSVQTTQDDWIM